MHVLHSPVDGLITESLTTSAVHTKDSEDIPSTYLRDVFHLIRVHPDHSTDLDLFLCGSIGEGCALFKLALIDTDVCDLSELALLQFESETYEWLLVVNLCLYLLIVLLNVKGVILNFRWHGQIVKNSI